MGNRKGGGRGRGDRDSRPKVRSSRDKDKNYGRAGKGQYGGKKNK